MLSMKRIWIATATLAATLLALLPASALARTVELGVPKSALVTPSCPSSVKPTQCTIILTEVTALETISDGVAYPTTVKADGQLVAFTLGLSNLSSNRTTAKNEIKGLDATYGGVPQAQIAVLRKTGKKSQRKYKVIAESPIVHLIPYLGQVAQFPLTTSLPVKRGDVIGLSVPTWAPVLSINLPSKSFAYRQGRTGHCSSASTSPAAQRVKQTTAYNCNYPGTRVEYSATEVTSPTPTPNYVH